ncbi:AAA family ATPase [Adlercreutzia murintestinalis]|uniref:AAA family ATPase n=1 Tax=Adlercreutzia murintestinalis TaxID=2941325 RepID=UPI00203AB4CC|nr:P-loop NTPase [Adlercreutzia murintestinalis]
MSKVLFCSDPENLAHPELLGLEEVNLAALPWLECEGGAHAARTRAAEADIGEVWVEGSDHVDAVNLAAAMRTDDAEKPILVVAHDASGSLRSRAQAAGITGMLTSDGLLRRISMEKERRARMDEAARDLEANLDAALAEHSRAAVLDEIERSAATEAFSSATDRAASLAALALRSRFDSTKRPESAAYMLTVLSGSGGAGKSTVALVAAHVAAAKGHTVLLFDGDLQFGDLVHLMGATDALTADDVLAEPERLQQLADGLSQSGVALLAAPSKLEQAEVVTGALSQLLDAASALFDVVIVNTGASWAESHAALIERSDCALFLIDQKASSVRACRHAVDLCERLGIATANFEYAINRCRRGALFTSIDVSCAMQGAHVFELKEGGTEVEELLGAGSADELLHARNDLCTSVSAMLDELLPSCAGRVQAKRGGRARMGGRKAEKAGDGSRSSRRRGKKRAVLPGVVDADTRGENVKAVVG